MPRIVPRMGCGPPNLGNCGTAALVWLGVFGRASAFVFLPHGGDLAEIIRPTFGCCFPAFCSQRGRWGLLKEIVSEMNRSSQQLIGSLGTAFGQVGRHQEGLRFRDKISE